MRVMHKRLSFLDRKARGRQTRENVHCSQANLLRAVLSWLDTLSVHAQIWVRASPGLYIVCSRDV